MRARREPELLELWLVEAAAALDAGVSLSIGEQRLLMEKVIQFIGLIEDSIGNPN